MIHVDVWNKMFLISSFALHLFTKCKIYKENEIEFK